MLYDENHIKKDWETSKSQFGNVSIKRSPIICKRESALDTWVDGDARKPLEFGGWDKRTERQSITIGTPEIFHLPASLAVLKDILLFIVYYSEIPLYVYSYRILLFSLCFMLYAVRLVQLSWPAWQLKFVTILVSGRK